MAKLSKAVNQVLGLLGLKLSRTSRNSSLNNQPLLRAKQLNRNNIAMPLPTGAEQELRADHPKLHELRSRYQMLDVPMVNHSLWSQDRLQTRLDLAYFRGNNVYRYQIQNVSTEAQLKLLIFSLYVRSIDRRGLLNVLKEDGAFGCWTFNFHGFPTISRDLLDSISEIYFLDDHLPGGLFARKELRVLDVGAGYGRLAHRMLEAVPQITRYSCTDAIAESTFISEYYLKYRACMQRAEVLPLDELVSAKDIFEADLAVNIHSFSEMTHAAISGWLQLLAHCRIPFLMIVPNDPDHFLSREPDGRRKNFSDALDASGYQLLCSAPATTDLNLAELGDITERRYLFRLESAEPRK